MKVWLLTILLIFTAAGGSAQSLSGVRGDSASAVLLPEGAADTVASTPYCCLQDMIQPESASQASCSWKRLYQDLPAWGAFRPELSLPSAYGACFHCDRFFRPASGAVVALCAPPRAGPAVRT